MKSKSSRQMVKPLSLFRLIIDLECVFISLSFETLLSLEATEKHY